MGIHLQGPQGDGEEFSSRKKWKVREVESAIFRASVPKPRFSKRKSWKLPDMKPDKERDSV